MGSQVTLAFASPHSLGLPRRKLPNAGSRASPQRSHAYRSQIFFFFLFPDRHALKQRGRRLMVAGCSNRTGC